MAHTSQLPPHSHRGFTLVEAMSAIVILAIVLSVCSRVVLTTADGYVTASARAELSTNLAAAMDRVVAELRTAAVSPDLGVGPDISQIRPTSITFNTASGARMLRLSAGSVILTVGTTDSTLLQNVTAFDITTYRENGAALPTTLDNEECSDAQRIQILMTVQRFGVTESLRTRVFFRAMIAGGVVP